jgi:DNA recombination protein RmuC
MNSITIDPLLIQYGLPALGTGLLLGVLVTWMISRKRRRNLEERIQSQDELARERDIAFEAANTHITRAFSELANQSLQANSETFLKLAEQNLGTQQEKAKRELSEREQAVQALVKPIRDALEASKKQIDQLENSRREAYGGIKAQLEEMRSGQKSLQQETHNLVNALRRPEVRGRWGEITLRRLVELAGMVEHCDFQEQVHTTSEGQAIRPDMVINLPEGRQLVVDVKTPLDAYLEAAEAATDEQRDAALARHARNVHSHIRMLASKAYWEQFEDSPDYVILFIPGDQFLSAALNEKPDLLEFALAKQIILATPTSLVALLKGIAYSWRQLALADNAREIRGLAEDLYSRLGVFVGHMNMMGRQLSRSVDHYNRAVGSLERSVLPGARKFVELGVHENKPIEKLETLDPVPRTMIEGGSSDDEDTVNKH